MLYIVMFFHLMAEFGLDKCGWMVSKTEKTIRTDQNQKAALHVFRTATNTLGYHK